MSFLDFFRGFWKGPHENNNQGDSELQNEFRNPIWDTYDSDSDNDLRNPHHQFSFNIYSDPLQMHRYFEQQMNEMLKGFTFMEEAFRDFDSFFHSGNDRFPQIEQPFDNLHHPPALEEPKSEFSQSLRDQLLKPEFKRIESPSQKVDTILDGKVDARDIGKALDSKDSLVPIWTPNDSEKLLIPNKDSLSFSGRSFSTSIVRRPDGTVIKEEIVKNSDGSETKTVTHSAGDHEYSVSTFRDASGVEKKTEHFKNIDPDKLDNFNNTWDVNESMWKNWWRERNPFF